MPLFTAIGLAVPAGLNAYIPLLAVAVALRTGLLRLAAPYDVLGQWWAIGLLAALLLIEVFADKVPAVDHVNDAIQTVVRPAAGGILFVASSGEFGRAHPALMIVAGILVAGGVHAVKATARPAVNVTTAGFGAPVVSVIEDVIALVTSVLALLAPVLVVVALSALVWLFWRLLRAKRRAGPVREAA